VSVVNTGIAHDADDAIQAAEKHHDYSTRELNEMNLQCAVSQQESVEIGYRDQRLLVVAHRHKAKALALLRREVAHHLDVAHGAERPEQLPESLVVGVWRQVVDKQAPATAATIAR